MIPSQADDDDGGLFDDLGLPSSSEDVELGVEQVAHRKVVVAQSTVHADLAPPAEPFRFLMRA